MGNHRRCALRGRHVAADPKCLVLRCCACAEGLREHFQEFGTITDAVVMRDRATGKPRGFGFVSFSSADAADAALAKRHTVCGRVIDAKRCVPREEMRDRPPPPAAASLSIPRKLFVAGLAPSTKDDAFRAYFERFGTVVESSVVVDHVNGASRGFGFVTYESDASAEAVLAPDAAHELEGQPLSVRRAAPKRAEPPPQPHRGGGSVGYDRGRGGPQQGSWGGGGGGSGYGGWGGGGAPQQQQQQGWGGQQMPPMQAQQGGWGGQQMPQQAMQQGWGASGGAAPSPYGIYGALVGAASGGYSAPAPATSYGMAPQQSAYAQQPPMQSGGYAQPQQQMAPPQGYQPYSLGAAPAAPAAAYGGGWGGTPQPAAQQQPLVGGAPADPRRAQSAYGEPPPAQWGGVPQPAYPTGAAPDAWGQAAAMPASAYGSAPAAARYHPYSR